MKLDDLLAQIQDMHQRLAQMLSTAQPTPSQQQQIESIATSFQELCTAKVEPQVVNEKLNSSSSDRFELLASSLDCIIYDWDIENGTVYRTQGLAKVVGYHPQEAPAIQSWWSDRIHPEDKEQACKLPQDTLFAREYRILNQDNQYLHVLDKGLIIRNGDGKPVRVVGSTMDISERKRTEAALRESEQRLQAILDNTPTAVFLKDLQGRYLMVNRQCARDMRLTREQIIGKTDYDLLPEAIAEQFSANDREVLASQTPLVAEEQIEAEDGLHTCLVTKFPLLDATGVPYAVCGMCTDITERKRTEEAVQQLNEELENRVQERTESLEQKNQQLKTEIARHQQTLKALQESEQWFRQLAENIREVFWISTPGHTQIIYASPAYEEIWGCTCENLYAEPMSWLEAVHPDDCDRVVAALKPVKQGEYDQKYRIVRPDGTVRWIRDRAFPVRDEQGKIYRLAGIAEDITEQKLAEAEIEKALQRERELSELTSRFIYIASHEFRTPLTGILSSAEMLERFRHRYSQEEQLTHLHRIQTAVGQMTQLLDDVLLIGKAEAGRLEFNPTPVDLVQFCRDLVEVLQLADQNQHEVVFTHQGNCTKDRSFPLLDEKLLRQILSNLLSNGIKYSPTSSAVQFNLTCLNDQAIFQIQDEGIGIPPEDVPRLFETFHRASNVGQIKGTGLGLAIVKQCVDLLAGEISVESVVERGTTFTVTLPLSYSKG